MTENLEAQRIFIARLHLNHSAHAIIERMCRNKPEPVASGDYEFIVNGTLPLGDNHQPSPKEMAERDRDAASVESRWQMFVSQLEEKNVLPPRKDRLTVEDLGDYKVSVLRISPSEMQLMEAINADQQVLQRIHRQTAAARAAGTGNISI